MAKNWWIPRKASCACLSLLQRSPNLILCHFQRSRRLFGNLLGTLQKFRQDENKSKDRELKKREIELKIEEKTEKEKDEAKKKKQELFHEREKQKQELITLQVEAFSGLVLHFHTSYHLLGATKKLLIRKVLLSPTIY